jgi:hypothetical protein
MEILVMPNGNPTMHASDGVTLEKYFSSVLSEMNLRYEQRFAAQEHATRAALASAQLAVDKAEVNNEKWRGQANEWRGTMDDREKNFARRESLEAVEKKVDELESLRDIASGKASQNSVIGAYVLSAIGLLVIIIKAFIK